MGEAVFNQFMKLKNQPVKVAKNFARVENLKPVLIHTMSKDMHEQLKLAHKAVDVVDRANRKLCVTLLVVQCGQAWEFLSSSSTKCKEQGDETFQQVVSVNYKLEKFIFHLMLWILYLIKLLLINPFVMFYKKYFHLFFYQYFYNRVKLRCKIGDNRNLFLKLKSKLVLYHIVITTPKTAPEELTLTIVEMRQLPDIEKTDSKEELSCLKSTICNGRGKICVNSQTATDKLNIAVYRYRNNLYLKDNEVDLKLTEYQSLLANRIYLLSYIDIFYKRCIVLDETTVYN